MLKRLFYYIGLVAILLLSFMPAQPVSAHAGLVQAVPDANSELRESPAAVALTFNERLEEGLYYLRVYDSNKRRVTEQPAVLNEAHTVLTLQLPPLEKGTYLTTYHVISADGHPVEGSYLFAVGQTLDTPSGTQPDASMEHMHRHDGLLDAFGTKDVLQYAARIAFYMTMLALTGWLMWMRWFGVDRPDDLRLSLKRIAVGLQQTYTIVYILFMGAHLGDLIGDGGTDSLVRLFTQTTIGYAWLGGLLLALLSFVCLYHRAWLDYAWVALVWFAKSLLGHAAAFEPRGQTLLLDWLHLGAASVWVGGLVMLLYFASAKKEAFRVFLPMFSSAALWSVLLLAVSGAMSVFIFLPDISYVLETSWGLWLLAKTALVLLVVLTAAVIRRLFKRKRERTLGVLVRIDAGLMACIVVIVGIFTYMTPLPPNEPLRWHVMGEKQHMTAQISPNAPGVNDFTVKVWLPEKLGEPKQVLMKLHAKEMPDVAPFQVPLEPVEDNSVEESFGMKRYTYKARGAYLPYAGTWQLEVRVMDSNDDETVYHNEVRIY